jgi:hypothetical protein
VLWAAARPYHGHFKIPRAEYAALADLSNRLEQVGVKTDMIGKGAFGSGCRLQLQGKLDRYELHLDGAGRMSLGVIENGRCRMLAQCSTTALDWSKVFAEISNHEERKAATL